MFRPSAFVLLAALAKLALALNPGDLAVSLKAAQSSFTSAQDIAITAVVSNPTDKDVKVLAVNNVLDPRATKSFNIKSSDGQEVTFAGVEAVFDLSQEQFYITIPAGKSVEVQHTAEYYDFSNFAPGTTFTVSPRKNTYQGGYDDAIIEVESNTVDVTAESVDFKVPEAFKGIYEEKKGLTAFTSSPRCSDGNYRNRLVTSLSYARSLAGGAASNIDQDPNSSRFNRYFGGNNAQDVRWRFDAIAGDINQNRDITCSRDNGDASNYCNGNPGIIAYTVVITSGGVIVGSPIYTCELFLQSGSTSSICDTHTYDSTMSSDGGIILHELSHATHGTSDLGYGCNTASGIPSQNKYNNADNYRCMALDVYLSWNCVNGPRK